MTTNNDLTEVKIVGTRYCDLCADGETVAQYDARTSNGQWGYLCEKHFKREGCTLGLGKGQKLVYVPY